MSLYRIFGLFAVLGVLLLTSACGGGEPVALSDIPVFPDASSIEAGQNDTADLFLETVSASLPESMTSDANLYTLPAATTWAEVQTFYNDGLADTDWELADELANESEAINTMGFSRGSFASEQVLMISQGSDILSGEGFLIVALFSE